ncbi:MAG TPA: hypothetical protein VG294_19180 [Solirubrobacteraceae bacterium]|nr:hypothetical protein [Solirubrobacteraceae bacterium]
MEQQVTVGRYAVAVAALLVVSASMAVAATSLRARLLPSWSGAPARLAEFVLGFAVLIGVLEVLGALGLFELGPVVAVCLVAAVAARARSVRPGARGAGTPPGGPAQPGARGAPAQPGARGAPAAPAPPGAPTPALAVAVALIAAVLVIVEWAQPALASYDIGIRSFDSLWYHLPWAASFAQTGRVTSLRFTDVEYLTAFYPATAELVHGLGIVLVGRDTLSPAINLGWLALTLLAAWCIGSPRGLGPATMTGAALALATPMLRISQGGTAANDIAGVFFLLAAAALVVNACAGSASARAPSRAALVLAAVAAGLAVSVKLSLLAPVLALSVGAILVTRRGRRGSAAAAWFPALILAGGYWYLRNLIAVGNPLPWLSLGILPTPTSPLQQHTGFAIVHYATDTGIWSRFFGPGLAAGLGPWWVAVVVVAVLGPVLCVVARSDATARMLGLVALVALGAYLITPETAAGPAGDPSGFAFNLRYAAPGLTLALAVTPLAGWLDGARARLAVLAVLALLLAATLAEGRLWNGSYVLGATVVAAAALAALGAALVLAGRPAVRVPVIAGAGVLLAALTLAGYAGQRHYLRGRYTFQPGVSSLSRLWAWARDVRHARIGLVGTFGGFFAYPLLGLDDSNRVNYLARHGAHGSFTPILTCRAWRAAVNAGRYRYLVTTPARDPWHPRGLEYSPEGRWTASDRAARVVFRQAAHGQPISVFELTGPLTPGTCPAQGT